MVRSRPVKRTKQMPLTACPSEIISQILGSLDRTDLSGLALSSRPLNVIATPYLYEHIELFGLSQHWLCSASTDCWNLTVLLLERPQLARYVRHFTMRNAYSSNHRSEQVESAHLPRALLKAIETASHSKEEERQWLEDTSSTKPINGDALMALLLPALPNLRTLDLELGEKVTYLSRMMQRASGKEKPFDTAPAFERLSDITCTQNSHEDVERYDGEAEEQEYPCYPFTPFPLPAVSRILGFNSIFQVGSANQNPWVLPLAWGFSSQLSHLELRECLLTSEDVVNLLRVPTALKTFIYEVAPKTPDSSNLNVNIYKAMEYQKGSLENIWLDFFPLDEELVKFPQLRDAKPMPSFADFNNLKTLRIASPFLFGDIRRLRRERKGHSDILASLLPEGLHTLHITRCDHHIELIEKPLEFFLLRLPNTTHLRKIIIEHPYSQALGGSSRIIELIQLAEGKNISLIAGQAGLEHVADGCYDWEPLSMYRCRVGRSWGVSPPCRDGSSYAEVARRKQCASTVYLLNLHKMPAFSTQ